MRHSAFTECVTSIFFSTNDEISLCEQRMIECLLLTTPEKRSFQATVNCGGIITN